MVMSMCNPLYEATLFHDRFKIPVETGFTAPHALEQRRSKFCEEAVELDEALDDAISEYVRNGVISVATAAHVIKEMTDVKNMLASIVAMLGVDLEEAYARTHMSNMTKTLVAGKITSGS
jgi:NTP pyrophosphatase (non-canonical NTP hydrolase)